ncbi:MAG: desulfoferrodoxin family protein [Erysipelotrichaceae bacterium]|nr:desulfoferrodoxin family protein [Erysipelotrichaceae bacterium]
MNFLECQRGCGTLVYEIEKGECTPECCGAEMVEPLIHHPDEEGNEKHVPLVHQEGNKLYVKVGSTLHPMEENHYIEWIFLLTDKGTQRKVLHPGMVPEVVFYLDPNEIVLSVIARCNKHGLWEADI